MKHRFSFVVTLWWVLILASAGIFLLVTAPREERLSGTENRTLAGAPEVSVDAVLSAEFMTGFESWLSDSFFARDSVIALTDTMLAKTSMIQKEVDMEEKLLKEQRDAEDKLKEIEVEQDPYIEEVPEDIPLEVVNAGEVEEKEEYQTTDIAEEVQEEEAFSGKATFWLDNVKGGKTTVYTFSKKNINTVAKMLNSYRDVLGEDGTIHYMQIPFSQMAYRWLHNTKTYNGWGCNVEDALQAKVKDGVYIHNVPEILLEHMKAGEYLYFRLDHHWTPLAASYVANAIMESQGYPTVDYTEYEYTVHNTFYGSHYDASDMARMKRMADRLEVVHPLMPAKHYLIRKLDQLKETDLMNYKHSSYTAYLFGTRGPWRIIDTGYDTGRTALIICDSFGTTFTPYLLPYYDKVVITDLRPDYYNKSEAGASVRKYIEHYGVDDVYMVLSTVSTVNNQYSLSYMMKYLN